MPLATGGPWCSLPRGAVRAPAPAATLSCRSTAVKVSPGLSLQVQLVQCRGCCRGRGRGTGHGARWLRMEEEGLCFWGGGGPCRRLGQGSAAERVGPMEETSALRRVVGAPGPGAGCRREAGGQGSQQALGRSVWLAGGRTQKRAVLRERAQPGPLPACLSRRGEGIFFGEVLA